VADEGGTDLVGIVVVGGIAKSADRNGMILRMALPYRALGGGGWRCLTIIIIEESSPPSSAVSL
jgi:hypothetical protein